MAKKIGIISDTHGLLRPEVLEILKTCDCILHAGDVDRPEILDQLRQKQVTVIRSPFGYALAPIGYTGPDQYRQLMRGFWGATGFEISGDGDEAIQILD